MLKIILGLAVSLSGQFAFASPPEPKQEMIYDTRNQMWLNPDELAMTFQMGDTVILGEQHATDGNKDQDGVKIHHGNQVLLIDFMRQRALPTSVGMEFFEYTKQATVDQYLNGKLGESDFLTAVGWSSGDAYDLYREQVLAPLKNHGTTVALNIPRSISAKVGVEGPDALSMDERAMLPPIWERGSAPYFERFSQAMNGHVAPAQIENYFLAQSLWDDTMAWNVSKYRKLEPRDVLMIIVGEFHVEFGHGLPARLARYGVGDVYTVLQTEVSDWEDETLEAAVAPDPKYGPRARFIWVYLP